MSSPDELYDEYERIESAFQSALDEPLEPRGPELLYSIVASLGIAPDSIAVDVGCGRGRHALELADRLRLRVLGIDPVMRQIRLASQALEADAVRALRSRIGFTVGTAEGIPVRTGAVDLVWCREAIALVSDLDKAAGEFARVLRRGGRALVYQVLSTHRISERDAAELWRPLGVRPGHAEPERIERAFRRAGLNIDECVVIGSEWGERAEETRREGTRRLLHAARLLRAPERYLARFGQRNYDVMLSDCLWHVYRMIGKLAGRAYVLSKP